MWWLWKHRHSWRQLKELWDNRVELTHFMQDIYFAFSLGKQPTRDELQDIGERATHHRKWLRNCDTGTVPLLRPIPPRPKRYAANLSKGDRP